MVIKDDLINSVTDQCEVVWIHT